MILEIVWCKARGHRDPDDRPREEKGRIPKIAGQHPPLPSAKNNSSPINEPMALEQISKFEK